MLIQGHTLGPLERGRRNAPISALVCEIKIVQPCSAAGLVSQVVDSIMKTLQTLADQDADRESVGGFISDHHTASGFISSIYFVGNLQSQREN